MPNSGGKRKRHRKVCIGEKKTVGTYGFFGSHPHVGGDKKKAGSGAETQAGFPEEKTYDENRAWTKRDLKANCNAKRESTLRIPDSKHNEPKHFTVLIFCSRGGQQVRTNIWAIRGDALTISSRYGLPLLKHSASRLLTGDKMLGSYSARDHSVQTI